MDVEQEFHLNGQNPPEETVEELESVHLKLNNLAAQNGSLTSLTKQDISLLKQMLHTPEASDDFIRITLICDFLDETEANNELEAFYEAERLGMNTKYNIAHALSRAAINRKGSHRSSRVATLLDALSHQKYTTNQPRGSGNGSTNPRSPLS
jgi:hypothetical protein